MRQAPLLVLAVLGLAPSARALDRFEVQVYDGHTNAPGLFTLENHVNLVGRGAKAEEPPELPSHHQFHWTFEGALGVTPFWEPGLYIQTARLPDGSIDFAGSKLRSKFTAAPLLGGRLRLAANFELADVPRRFEEGQWSIELRPIAAVEAGRVRVALNPIVGVPLAGTGVGKGPGFEPAVSLKGLVSQRVALGVEYYGDWGPIAAFDVARDQHYLFWAGDYDLGRGVELNVGAGGGIGGAADPFVMKAILGFEMARLWRTAR
jgi:hypothetical protein